MRTLEKRQRLHGAGAHALPPAYTLCCPVCGARHDDSGDAILLDCPANHAPALLRAEYAEKRLVIQKEQTGVFRYGDWLPVRRSLPGMPGPAVYRSVGLARELGLDKLTVIFSGYWPDKGARMRTCTFKELEAQAVCGRIPSGWGFTLVVSSAGNTARAFLSVCSQAGVPALIVVPESSAPLVWSAGPLAPFVRVALIGGGADYTDAILLGNEIARCEGYCAEGGAKNAARRDGMGMALLAAVEAEGAIPEHYVQAVGSGTGAIAAWEMNLRLLEDGRFGARKARLHLAQNIPFTPMTDAWATRSRQLPEMPVDQSRRCAHATRAGVLANRTPPYSLAGGLFDALCDTRGHMYGVSNDEAARAGRLFEQVEGCDLDPAAEVAVAALIQAVRTGRIPAGEAVALNITGGGLKRLRKEERVRTVQPALRFTLEDLRAGRIAGIMARQHGKEASG